MAPGVALPRRTQRRNRVARCAGPTQGLVPPKILPCCCNDTGIPPPPCLRHPQRRKPAEAQMYGSVAPDFRPHGFRPHGFRPPANYRPERFDAAAGERYAEIVVLPVRAAAATDSGTSGQHGSFELQLLGGFRLTGDSGLVDVGRTGQRLLAMLACRGRQATRAQIAHALWPDTTTTDRAHANLRTALYR